MPSKHQMEARVLQNSRNFVSIRFHVVMKSVPFSPLARNSHALCQPVGLLTHTCIKLRAISNATRLHSNMSNEGLTTIVLCSELM